MELYLSRTYSLHCLLRKVKTEFPLLFPQKFLFHFRVPLPKKQGKKIQCKFLEDPTPPSDPISFYLCSPGPSSSLSSLCCLSLKTSQPTPPSSPWNIFLFLMQETRPPSSWHPRLGQCYPHHCHIWFLSMALEEMLAVHSSRRTTNFPRARIKLCPTLYQNALNLGINKYLRARKMAQ